MRPHTQSVAPSCNLLSVPCQFWCMLRLMNARQPKPRFDLENEAPFFGYKPDIHA
jgi:hypothetical protein